MQLETIKLAEAYEAENNPRGKDFKGPAFDDLVASVKEKGVLVPIIVRPRGKSGKLRYEVVAGNRRFRAAQFAGMKEIPARIEELSDSEMQEIQIIENLQREDVHPLEEGQAYRKLVEESHHEISNVAAKVGKSETYVRQRIFLTRLEADADGAYRSGKIKDGHAVLIAKLSSTDQSAALKWLTSYGVARDVSELKRHIEAEFYKPLEHQPWLKESETLAAVGPCSTCPPNVPSLFGAVKEGACTDLKCWKKKMAKYVAFRKEKDPKLVLVSKEYMYNHNAAGDGAILYENHYAKPGPKDKCQHSVMALVAKGPDTGSQIRVCIAPECKVHGKRHSTSSRTLSPAEKAKREKERLAEIAREKKKDQEQMATALKKVKWPLQGKTLAVLLDIALKDFDNDIDEIGERRYPDTKPSKGESGIDWTAVMRKALETMTDAEKAKLFVELMIMNVWGMDRAKFMKQL